jgi:hypothetical protein
MPSEEGFWGTEAIKLTEPPGGQQEFYQVLANGVTSVRKIHGDKMAPDRGFTSDPLVDILTISEINASP